MPGDRQKTTALSELDRRIIRMLQSDGRVPYTDMARELGISSRTARRRVERLLEDGVIEITTVADPELLGYHASAFAGIRVLPGAGLSEVASSLMALDAVDYVAVATGRYHLLAEVLCPTVDDLVATLDTRIRTLPGVGDVETFPYLSLPYQQPQWDAARVKRQAPAGAGEPLELDELDRRIVVALNLDGRASFRGIAEKLGVSEGLVRQRTGRLIDAHAIRVMAITNPESLGFPLLAWLAIVARPGVRLEDLAERVSGCTAIAYLSICTGRFDVLAEAVCTDRHDLLRLLDDEIRPMPEVQRVEVSICTDLRYRRLPPRFDEPHP